MKRIACTILAALAALIVSCACASAQSEPYLRITSIPRYGNSRGVLRGMVFSDDKSKINVGKYRVAVYLEVDVTNGGYTGATPWNAYAGYPKPSYGRVFTRISKSGAFSVDVTTGGVDQIARSYTVLLVMADSGHRVVDVQRVIRYQGLSYAYSIDARRFRAEPSRFNAPAVKAQRLAVMAGKSAPLPAVYGYAGNWTVQDETCAKIAGTRVAGLSAHKTTTLTFTVSRVLDYAHPYNGKILSVNDEIDVKLFVTCSGCSNLNVKLKKTRATVRMGQMWQVQPGGKNPCPWRRELTCRSSKDTIARVSETGLVTPLSPGKVRILVTNVFGNSKAVILTIKTAK